MARTLMLQPPCEGAAMRPFVGSVPAGASISERVISSTSGRTLQGSPLVVEEQGVSLPCLYSHNCIEGDLTLPVEGVAEVNRLQGSHRRTAFILAFEIQELAAEFGLDRLGFLTLTFADHVISLREGQRRFHSLNSDVLRHRYERAIGVWERQKSGRIHFHLLVVLAADIRTGFDFGAVERGDYRSANLALRSEWAFWRSTAPRFRFGRTELLPVRSSAEGIARYVGKYVSKHIAERVESDKGARVVRYLGFKAGDRHGSSRFGWNTDNAWLWRQKVAAFARTVEARDFDDLSRLFGPRWCWFFQKQIMSQSL